MNVATYRDIGIRLTPQRLAILEYLAGNTQHPSAEEIYQAVVKRFPTMSFATVYTTLAALKKSGNVLELTIDPNKKRYDPRTEGHSHLICIACKKVVDVAASFTQELSENEKQEFSIIHTHVEFYGLCPKCKTTSLQAQGGTLCA